MGQNPEGGVGGWQLALQEQLGSLPTQTARPSARHQDPTTCAGLSWVFLRGPNPIILSSTSAPSAAFSNSLKWATSTQVSTGNVDAALTPPLHAVCPPTPIVTKPCQLYHHISPSLHFSPSLLLIPLSQAFPISFLDPSFLGALHSKIPHAVRGYLEKNMLTLHSHPGPFCVSPLPLEPRPAPLPQPSRPSLPLLPA